MEATSISHSVFVMSNLSHDHREDLVGGAASLVSLLAVAPSSSMGSGRVLVFSPTSAVGIGRVATGDRRCWLIARLARVQNVKSIEL